MVSSHDIFGPKLFSHLSFSTWVLHAPPPHLVFLDLITLTKLGRVQVMIMIMWDVHRSGTFSSSYFIEQCQVYELV